MRTPRKWGVTLFADPSQKFQYYRSVVTSISPAVSGLTVSLTQGGESVSLVNHSGSMVEVLGYTGEPYLKIGPGGVEENVNSLSAFLNGSLIIEGLPQQMGSQQKAPSWKHVSDAAAFTWHDHRVHWMAQQPPPVVSADPKNPHKVFGWTLDVTAGGRPVVVAGTLTWLGKPAASGLVYVLYGLGATVIIGMAGLVYREQRIRRAGSAQRAAADAGDEPARTPQPFDVS